MTVSRIVNRDYVIDWLDIIDAMIISIRTFYQLMIGGFYFGNTLSSNN